MTSPPGAVEGFAAPGGALWDPGQVGEIFDSFLEDYFAFYRHRSWADLRFLQDGLFASLAFGAAGIAYAHWYAGALRGDEELLERAERWILDALARQRGRLAFLGPAAQPGDRMPASACLYGRSGLYFVSTLIARTRGDGRAEQRSLRRFAELSREGIAGGRAGGADLYTGTSGCLTAAAILVRQERAALLLDLGADLAASLAQRAKPDRLGQVRWTGLRGLGLAHGAAGAFLALLLWSAASGAPLPAWFVPALRALLETAIAAPERFTPLVRHRARLCGGVMGAAFLGARAAQLLGDASLLDAARAAAGLALAELPTRPDLCCGRAGCAFALLPLAAQDESGSWRRLAHQLALSTLLCERSAWPATGLYAGEAAIACLALSIRSGIDSGPPCLDFITAHPGPAVQ